MNRTFIQATTFSKTFKELGFADEDLRRLEFMLLENPKAGAVIRGTGRLRKIRFARQHEGRSGGVRVCYVDFEEKGICYLLAIFAKNEQENLTQAQRNFLKAKIDLLDETLGGGLSG